jgi:hypothetical protein
VLACGRFRVAFKITSNSLFTSSQRPPPSARVASPDAVPAIPASLASPNPQEPSSGTTNNHLASTQGASQSQARGSSQYAATTTTASTGSGLFSWWADSSEAAGIGLALSSLAAGSSVSTCLAACTDDAQCALVFFEFGLDSSSSSSSDVVRCELRQGATSYNNTVRTLQRTRAAL